MKTQSRVILMCEGEGARESHGGRASMELSSFNINDRDDKV